MSFAWTWSTYGDVETKAENFGSTVHSNAGAHVTWTCEYASRLTISTNRFSVDELSLSDKLSSTGALNSGFALTLHEGPHITTQIDDQDWIRYFLALNCQLSPFNSNVSMIR